MDFLSPNNNKLQQVRALLFVWEACRSLAMLSELKWSCN